MVTAVRQCCQFDLHAETQQKRVKQQHTQRMTNLAVHNFISG